MRLTVGVRVRVGVSVEFLTDSIYKRMIEEITPISPCRVSFVAEQVAVAVP